MIKLLIATAVTVAAMACYPAVAHADETSFMQTMQSHGMIATGTDPNSVLAVAYTICADITANGEQGVAHQVALARSAGVSPVIFAKTLYITVNNLCPNDIAAANAWVKHGAPPTVTTGILPS